MYIINNMSNDLGYAQKNYTNESIQESVENASGINDDITDAIGQKNLNLLEKNKINLKKEKAIIDKERLFYTRARMLQVSRDRNSFKLKIIYTLLALIIFIFVASLGIYVFFKNKKGNKVNVNSK